MSVRVIESVRLAELGGVGLLVKFSETLTLIDLVDHRSAH